MAGRYQSKRRAQQFVAWAFALLTLLLTLVSALLGAGQAYRLRLSVDLSQISTTLTSAGERAGLSLAELLEAMPMDESVSPADLYRPQSVLGRRMEVLEPLAQAVRQTMDSLQDFDASLAKDSGLSDGVSRLVQAAQLGKTLVLAAAVLLAVFLSVSLVLLLCGRPFGAALSSALGALLSALVPLGLLTALSCGGGLLSSALSGAAYYGIDVSAALSLTGVGKAQILLASAALLTAGCCWLALAFHRRRRRRRTT